MDNMERERERESFTEPRLQISILSKKPRRSDESFRERAMLTTSSQVNLLADTVAMDLCIVELSD